jgi:hypothetical protein
MRSILSHLFVAALIGAPLAASAQPMNAPQSNTAAADQALHQEQGEVKNAYRSGNKKDIAQERSDQRGAYVADYEAHHPKKNRHGSSAEAKAAADRRLASAREGAKEAYRSGDQRAIAKARANERGASVGDYQADQQTPR